MSKKILCLLPISLLAACAGGGTAEPSTPFAIPVLKETKIVNDKSEISFEAGMLHDDDSKLVTLHTLDDPKQAKLRKLDIHHHGNFGPRVDDAFVYQTPDGKLFRFGTYNTPILQDGFSPSYTLKNSHEGQATENGGRLFACCSFQWRQASATRLDNVGYGAWIDPNGKVDLFVGGVPADVAKMQGAWNNEGKPKGTAIYEVWGVREKGGKFVTSSYTGFSTPTDGKYPRGKPEASYILVNFNTNKLGGTILGNQDYGPDVVMGNVDIVGNSFSGSAKSGGVNGNVEGKFFSSDGKEIGGKVVFDQNRSLDTVFGGMRDKYNPSDESLDLPTIAK
ncbi:Slam-dependent surface lipoprotein [Neisseria weaveri]|uniref:Slam-dependent surface lipoprotein n=1 Tax=Neisseria weaveri TaxID=28091 RepID=UPI0003129D21|nr:Slam-dependent surface lipoprotein [Neisseria weaveri]